MINSSLGRDLIWCISADGRDKRRASFIGGELQGENIPFDKGEKKERVASKKKKFIIWIKRKNKDTKMSVVLTKVKEIEAAEAARKEGESEPEKPNNVKLVRNILV